MMTHTHIFQSNSQKSKQNKTQHLLRTLGTALISGWLTQVRKDRDSIV